MKTIRTINIIDPSSSEFNRGSFCYAAYLAYNYLTQSKFEYEVNLFETFIPEDMDKLPNVDINLVCLWSYPQIETCQMLYNLLPMALDDSNIYFIGYTELILHLGLPHAKHVFSFDFLKDRNFILESIKEYPKNYRNFKRLLLSDCDMHLKKLEVGNNLVYPLFTSYGCPNGCNFCPSTTNCGMTRFSLSICETLDLLSECISLGINRIHFTDEDFFYDIHRAYGILNGAIELMGGFNFIALGSAEAVLRYISTYGTDSIRDSGLKIIEIGFESASEEMYDYLGEGKSLTACETLAQGQLAYPFDIFWLVQTFSVGETIASLNKTGLFMRKYGKNIDEVVGRLRTNGTKGGLGQYFQAYHGTGIYKRAMKHGKSLTDRPIRLFPSYIPNSFLNSEPKVVYQEPYCLPAWEFQIWLDFYQVPTSVVNYLLDTINGELSVSELCEGYPNSHTKLYICLAILARFQIIS